MLIQNWNADVIMFSGSEELITFLLATRIYRRDTEKPKKDLRPVNQSINQINQVLI